MSDDESILDVEGDEQSFEEYEWAGQTRVRACTMLPGGNYSSAMASTSSTAASAMDSDDELNVDGDDAQIYGPAQYSERDIIIPFHNGERNSSYLRELVIGPQSSTAPAAVAPSNDAGEGPSGLTNGLHENNQNLLNDTSPLSSPDASPKQSDAANQVIESLKAKIRDYEKYFQNKPKCLICLDDFKNPVVSICCWHVACEVCFLNQLGTKKLCPQCNMITCANDLRRIYL
jgi:E3 ubiquitin-protein ligase RNF220/Zinc finger, C3HC4 type (RING finger)